LAGRAFKGVRAVHTVSSTGNARCQNVSVAKEALRVAWQYRQAFSANQQKELDSWRQTSKVFREVVNGVNPAKAIAVRILSVLCLFSMEACYSVHDLNLI
jgi:hypothetical protein